MAEHGHARGVIDTSVVVDLDRLDPGHLPEEITISAVTLAELSAGPHATSDDDERARRQDRLQRTEATFEPLPVDANVARAYGRLYALLISGGGKTRGRRAMDLLIAATALDAGVPLYTRNPHDFDGLDELVTVIAI